ncbi:BQ2448_5876 [Microbotryum intermedium]|uniref:BQ2448_5876 protein n=1 Tax=Microbotryum intermedium TaxID=269621 RepID=A0A238EZF0_9BASI|nr:BQ2448_5876 [Microbotryum intermedium]
MYPTTTGSSTSKLPLPATAGSVQSYSPSGLAQRYHQLRPSSPGELGPDRIWFIPQDNGDPDPTGSSGIWNLYGRPNQSPSSSSSSESSSTALAAAAAPKRIAPQAPFVRAYLGPKSLTEYLDAHFPLSSSSDPQPHLWLTLADAYWSTTGAAALNDFVERMNQERWINAVRFQGGVKHARRTYRDTVVLTLCLDGACMEEMGKMDRYAFGGVATWPKLAGLIEVLKNRDVFFVDADVSDPYPHMEPFMNDYDLIAQENDAYDHFNTGWFWMRKGEVSSEAWNEVLKRDLIKVSRDQNNFNEVGRVTGVTKALLYADWRVETQILGTAELRACDPSQGQCNGRRPLKTSFVATNGLRVRVLDSDLFRANHFENDSPSASRHSTVAFHMTCGDDGLTKVYSAKTQGFWADVLKGYYTASSRLLTIAPLVGTKNDLTQLLKIVLMASKYTDRAWQPPSFATFLDLQELDSQGRDVKRVKRINSAFPLPHLEQALGVRIVEPTYAKNVVKFLVGGGSTQNRTGMGQVDQGWRDRAGVETSLGLLEEVELDMRQMTSIQHLLATLESEPFASAGTVKLMNHDWPERNHWQDWTLSRSLEHVVPCDRLEERPSCDRICRFKNGNRIVRVDQGWEEKEAWKVK